VGFNTSFSSDPYTNTTGQVTVIDTATNTVVTTLAVGHDTRQLTYDPVNGLVYVENYGYGNLTVINTTQDAVTGTVALGIGLALSQPVIDPTTGDFYLSDNNWNGSVFVYDPANGSVVARIPVGSYPAMPLYDPANGLVYVSNEYSDNVSVIATANNTVLGTIPAGAYPATMALDPTTSDLFVANWFSNATMVVNTSDPNGGSGTLGPGVTYSNVSSYGWQGSIELHVAPGEYRYSFGAVPGYVPTPGSGGVSVNASGAWVLVEFNPAPMPSIVFSVASGLPRGAAWSVTFQGRTETSTGHEIAVSAEAGVYSYAITGPANHQVEGVPASGIAELNRSGEAAVVRFVAGPTHALRFRELGLPIGSTWCVVVQTTYCSDAATLLVGNLPAGRYAYAIEAMTGETIAARIGGGTIPLSGTLDLSGANVAVVVSYSYRYPVTFTESGLPSGTAWSLKVDGVVHGSTSPQITVDLANGSHSVVVGAESGYTHSVNPSPVRVRGGPLAVAVAFTQRPARPMEIFSPSSVFAAIARADAVLPFAAAGVLRALFR
jgi:YVTN family beta-propeller protein